MTGCGPTYRRGLLAALAALAACGPTTLAPLAGPSRGRVILLRGLANMFSTGMNVLTAQLRARSFDASVHNYLEWRTLARQTMAAARDGTLVRPLCVIGHSFGADDAVALANRLGAQGVAVDLVVTFDPTGADPLGPGVLRALNLYQDGDLTFDRTLAAGPGFAGTLENRLVQGESHLSIDKAQRLHVVVIQAMEELAAARQVPATPPPPDPVAEDRGVAAQQVPPVPPPTDPITEGR